MFKPSCAPFSFQPSPAGRRAAAREGNDKRQRRKRGGDAGDEYYNQIVARLIDKPVDKVEPAEHRPVQQRVQRNARKAQQKGGKKNGGKLDEYHRVLRRAAHGLDDAYVIGAVGKVFEKEHERRNGCHGNDRHQQHYRKRVPLGGLVGCVRVLPDGHVRKSFAYVAQQLEVVVIIRLAFRRRRDGQYPEPVLFVCGGRDEDVAVKQRRNADDREFLPIQRDGIAARRRQMQG